MRLNLRIDEGWPTPTCIDYGLHAGVLRVFRGEDLSRVGERCGFEDILFGARMNKH